MERRIRDCQTMTVIARRLRRAMTPAEARLWEAVRDRRCGGLRFLRQHDVGHYVLDFYCASARLGIEVDGSVHDMPQVRENDAGREAILVDEMHIRFLRLDNIFVLAATAEKLHAVILAALTPGHPEGTRG